MILLLGPERNKILSILQGVDTEKLANQLNLGSAINGVHQSHEEKDKLREILGKVVDSQYPATCHKVVEKVANALETLPPPDIKRAGEIRNVCSSKGVLKSSVTYKYPIYHNAALLMWKTSYYSNSS